MIRLARRLSNHRAEALGGTMEKTVDAFRTISEVAQDLDLPQHVLRFWETRIRSNQAVEEGRRAPLLSARGYRTPARHSPSSVWRRLYDQRRAEDLERAGMAWRRRRLAAAGRCDRCARDRRDALRMPCKIIAAASLAFRAVMAMLKTRSLTASRMWARRSVRSSARSSNSCSPSSANAKDCWGRRAPAEYQGKGVAGRVAGAGAFLYKSLRRSVAQPG